MKTFLGDIQMNPVTRHMPRRRQRGQTIIVAMIVLGLLLILGFVFLGIINHSIKTSGFVRDRSIASDISEAGIRYAHSELLNSAQGADWRGQPTPPIDWIPGQAIETTRDPDALFIRPPATIGGNPVNWPGGNYVDRGGPDGLGPFFRIPNGKGRALVRVTYAPSDADIFRTSQTGALRHPGAVRNYILIESVGREGVISGNDPTRLLNSTLRRINNYGSAADFLNELSLMKGDQVHLGGLQVNRAFVSIGIIESARFITNKDNVSRPADIGTADDSGAFFRNDLVQNLPTQLGTSLPLLNFDVNTYSNDAVPIGGSLFSNADVMLHGRILANLNGTLGDEFDVAGHIGGDSTASLVLRLASYDPGGGGWGSGPYPVTTLGPAQFSSQSPTFDGAKVVRDGADGRDAEGYPRSVGAKVPPMPFGRDTATGGNRYREMTQGSGVLSGAVNTGNYGYGNGIYVNNFGDHQSAVDEIGRANQGGEKSLINEWLNPSVTGSYWTGYLYIPPGAYVSLLSDGVEITRKGAQQDERTWRLPDGTDTGSQSIRYKFGRGTDGRLHAINTYTVGNINSSALTQSDYQTGPVFNGVLYFEGNVRVRGTIPTDLQLTLVSAATIYVEGSITKGVTGNNWTATYSAARDNIAPTAQDQRLTRPSKSMLMLIAKDYVALNTTQFFGAAPTQNVQAKQDLPANVPSFNPLVVRTGSDINMVADFALDPNTSTGTSYNPSTWRSFATGYALNGSGGAKIPANILLKQTQDEGLAPATYIGLAVNGGTYMFPAGPNPPYANAYSQYNPGVPYINLYGLGTENYQRFGKFEGITLPLVDANSTESTTTIQASGNIGNFGMSTEGPNWLTIKPQSASGDAINDYVLGRLAIAPHDIRVEASMFAENGSFFVIPGPWFNPDPNDSYENWFAKTNNGADPDSGNLWRLDTFGSTPNIPFYGEPLDVRIVISGAISENMPPTASQQAEWVRKWGWIPKRQGAAYGADSADSDYANHVTIPYQHLSDDPGLVGAKYVPNIIIGYDPVLATGRRFGFSENLNDPGTYVRTRWIDYNMDGIQQISELVPLPPLPRLPVSPALAYFGEVH